MRNKAHSLKKKTQFNWISCNVPLDGYLQLCPFSDCPFDQYQCSDGTCIMREWLCDRQTDCASIEDEHEHICGECCAVCGESCVCA